MELRFDERGLLPPGDYRLTFTELRESVLVVGPGPDVEPNWDTAWRSHLVDQAEVLVGQLWDVGITEIFLDGSFVEQKAHPNDIDGYFVCDLYQLATGELQRELNQRDPHKIWTWDPASRRASRGYTKRQLPMWHRYRIELYPHAAGVMSGLVDEHGNELQFPAAFRRRRETGEPRGIVAIVREHEEEK